MTQSDPTPASAGTDVKAGLGVLLATCISALVVNANTSAVSILLPSIGEDVGAPVSTLQWAVTGYSLVGRRSSSRLALSATCLAAAASFSAAWPCSSSPVP